MRFKAVGNVTEPSQTEPLAVNLAVTHTIDLAPEDWAWATWRPRPVQFPEPPAVAAPAFKLKLAVNRLAKLLVNQRSGEWLWGILKFKPPIAKEAAHFWLTA